MEEEEEADRGGGGETVSFSPSWYQHTRERGSQEDRVGGVSFLS